MASLNWTQHWHKISPIHRLLIISAFGVAVFFLLPTRLSIPITLAIYWIIAGSLYLFLTYMMMHFSTEENILTLSRKEDASATIILLTTILASATSLAAIVMILANVEFISTGNSIWHVVLVLLTYTISWLLVHTAFTLHYAHAYYLEFEKTGIRNPLLI
jgi:uncharacterized membrane protein